MCNDQDKRYLDELLNVNYIDWDKLDGKSFIISGATGMIGSAIVNVLVHIANSKSLDIKIYGLIRNKDKANALFSEDVLGYKHLEFIDKDILLITKDDFCEVDYILHTASSTDSRYMKEHGVELINFAYQSTMHLLELARTKNSSFIFFSSMEVYGTPQLDMKITEEYYGAPNQMEARNSYPESKRLCECLCRCYYEQYKVSTFVIRLTQCFGTKIFGSDSRVFAMFAKSVVENTDIVLKTEGKTKRNYIYTYDAIAGIFTILLNGTPGEAYNIANEDTYCSIREMAELVCRDIADSRIKIRYEISDNSSYLPTLHMNLDCSKLRNLGWTSTVGLKEMFERFIQANF